MLLVGSAGYAIYLKDGLPSRAGVMIVAWITNHLRNGFFIR